ncbi:hypothetical protein T459_20380 [Capsicum annuum]|uniref:Uncharacterized protein n=1 Tax=Capsicum annuum TaxID=4072 RepID=A0A2G2Z4C4_CAPAN|nr:hypothetical protein T459_20380 [Capsicum annuum]
MKDLGVADVILGIEMHKTPQGWALSQYHYIENVPDKFKFLYFGIAKVSLNLDATVQDIPLGFVPATFDEQDPDWAENRSKHRNDPVTMKKLKDKATSKSKNLLQKQGVNVANKDAGHEDDFENEDYSDLKALEDVNLTAKEDVNEVKLKNQKSTNVTDGKVRELQASKINAPSKRERKKSRILRSPYISKCGSGSKDSIDFDKKEKLKYAFDGYTVNQDLPKELMIDYSQWIIVGLLKTHSAKYTTTSCFFKSYVEKTHTRYYPAKLTVELSAQQDYAESIVMAKNEDSIANIIHGFCMPAGLPWYMVDEVYVPINCDKLQTRLRFEGGITTLLRMFSLIEDGALTMVVQNSNKLVLHHLAELEVYARDMISGGALWELIRILYDCSRNDIRPLARQTLSSLTSQFEMRRGG